MIAIRRVVRSLDRGGRARHQGVLLRPLLDGSAFFAAFLFATAVATVPLSAMPSAVTEALSEQVQSLAATAVATDPPAPVVKIATASQVLQSKEIPGRTSAGASWLLLGLAMSGLAALNMAIIRHLRLSYAPARRRRKSL